MGIFDKAKDALGDNIEHVDAGIDKAADFVTDKTGNKHTASRSTKAPSPSRTSSRNSRAARRCPRQRHPCYSSRGISLSLAEQATQVG
mgnify:CR=1 FL=1